MCSLPLKVLQIGMTRNHGGLETYLLNQFNALDKTKVTYDFVNITGEYDIVGQKEIEHAGSKVFSVNSRHKNPVKHYYQWIKLLLKIHKDYNAIVLNTNSLEYIFPLFIAKFFGIPKRIIHSHNSGYERKIGIARKLLIGLNKFLLQFSATHYFACSEAAGKWMFGKHDFMVIHNAIRPKDFEFNEITRNIVREKFNLNNKFVIGHIGRFSYQKNHTFLIRVFAEIVKKHNDAVLMLIGNYVGDDYYWKQCHTMVQEMNLSNKVLFLGERKDVSDLMQAMDCFVFPSLFEGLGLVGIEAQANGLPCFFSENITREIKVSQFVHFLSLEAGYQHWVKKIIDCLFVQRNSNNVDLKRYGYDIDLEIKRVERFYKDL